MSQNPRAFPSLHPAAISMAPKFSSDENPSAGSSPPPVPPRSNPPLSPTERRVYDLLLLRQTERQVAEALGRSPNTVHVHVRNIYRKLGVRTRRELFELPLQTQKASRRTT